MANENRFGLPLASRRANEILFANIIGSRMANKNPFGFPRGSRRANKNLFGVPGGSRKVNVNLFGDAGGLTMADENSARALCREHQESLQGGKTSYSITSKAGCKGENGVRVGSGVDL
jgi:hypothetical protein